MSIHEKLQRIRKPRVHIKYEIETEDGVEERELPFVVGVLGDFSGKANSNLADLQHRKFVKIDRDNFDEVLANHQPKVSFRVKNTIDNDNSELNIDLNFNSLADFEPERIVAQVPILKKLKDIRDQLRDLLTKADCSPNLENTLIEVIEDPKKLLQLSEELEQL